MPEIVMVAAMDENRLIGDGKDLPWDIPEDLEHFMNTVENHPVIMGRKTFESMGSRPVNDKVNIVISSSEIDQEKENVKKVPNPKKAMEHVVEEDKVFIIGGATVYEMFLPFADKLILSHIEGKYTGDTYFPQFEEDRWEKELMDTYDKFKVFKYTRT